MTNQYVSFSMPQFGSSSSAGVLYPFPGINANGFSDVLVGLDVVVLYYDEYHNPRFCSALKPLVNMVKHT
jgi:hypothetical protein